MSARFIAVFCLFFTVTAHAQAPRTFSEAKKVAWKLYAPQSTEFYCGCKYNGNRVDLKACGYVPRKNANRADASNGNTSSRPGRSGISASAGKPVGAKTVRATTTCSSAPRRTCTTWCRASVRSMATVTTSVLDGCRCNVGKYGSCLTQVDFKAKKVMPRPSIRGMIARTYFYMSKQYGLRLSKQDRQLYEAWNKTYPVQPWERQRNQTVACVMGRGNEFVGPVNLKACG
uniref:Extracellular endonuclease n=1 Tax=Pseudomonas fluorescens biotype A TaxID=32035 RepID=ENDX_PSEFA|nr:RecName: Full=Extracellular endonuclease; Flags: Precursor [Pseudomonas fluorescens bv. A]CAB44359.1 extracellular endonuclease [Pseudomonas fluorescens]CAB44360.1 extracellular endonuclease [Pseudomonas fluorescens]